MKVVIQYTRDGDHKIARYQSMAEAAKAMGVTKTVRLECHSYSRKI